MTCPRIHGFLLFGIAALYAQNNDVQNAKLEGDVFNEANKTPLAGVRVKVEPRQGEALYARTDAKGHFIVPALSSGLYSVTAETVGFHRQQVQLVDISKKSPLVSTMRQSMAIRGLGSFPSAVVQRSISDDGVLQVHIAIPLVEYSIIYGRVTDPDGRPMEGANIEFSRKTPIPANRPGYAPSRILPDGRNELSPIYGERVQTNDKGEFRSPKLESGTYYIVANKPFNNMHWEPAFRSTYHPAAFDVGSAEAVVITAGQQVRADVQVLRQRGLRIAGRLIKPSTSANLRVTTIISLVAERSYLQYQNAPYTSANDEYEFRDVMPGRYVLMAYTRDASSDPFGPTQVGLFGLRQTIEIADRDLDRLDLELQPLRELSGTVTFREGCKPAPIRLSVNLSPRAAFNPPDVTSEVDGSFVLRGLLPGKLSVNFWQPNFYIESTVFRKVDVLGKEFDLPAFGDDKLQITVTCDAARRIR